MAAKDDDDRYSEKETAARAEKVIRHMIATPPQPRRKPDKASSRRPRKKERSNKG